MSQNFCHLHSHSYHSVLDGYGSPEEMVKQAAELGQPGIAVTDHGSMSGAYELYKAAKKYGIKPIVGIEAYMTPGDLDHRIHEARFFGSGDKDNKEERSNDVSGAGAYTHMTLLAENNEGMHNLFRLNSIAFAEGNHRKPRMSVELLSQNSTGIIGTTGCPSGELQTRLRLGQWKEAIEYASKMQDILGKENYFLELMDHSMSIDLERRVRGDLMKVAKQLNIPLLATNDLHYVQRDNALSHEHMLAIQSGSSMNEPSYEKGGKRFAFEGEEYYVKTGDEMLQYFSKEDYPGAVDNTLLIAERCNISFDYDPNLRPSVPLPDGHTEDSYLRELAFEGLAKKIPEKANDPEYIARMNKELDVFKTKNFSGYMLVVSDFMRWSKRQGWQVGAARGSGGGSLLAYCTDITEIDPIPHGLIFERFLNPDRDSPPDIDSDFDDINRPKVIQYVRDTYGEEMVAMIITFGKIKTKNAIKDITRIFDEPYVVGEKLTKLVPPDVAGFGVSLANIYDKDHPRFLEADEFRKTAAADSTSKKIVEAALGIEGRLRSTGVHAAGVIMSSKPLIDVIPLMTRKEDGITITQFDYPTCEDLGLIKMDFLGIRNLTVVDKCLKAVERNHGVKIDTTEFYKNVLNEEDPKTYKLLQSGHTLGVFQFDSGGIAALVKSIGPTKFGDISAATALYRPGPMGMNSHNLYADRKNGRAPVIPIHPETEEALAEIVEETYGVIAYQEQVMAIAQKLAGYTLGQADSLRRIMGKKKKKDLEVEFPKFQAGMKANGFSEDAVQTIWNTLIPFAEYGFNKSHSAGYGLLTYLTAYLKANYPAEFMAANLSTLTDDKDKTALYLEECRNIGVKVSPPSVSYSTSDYTATSGSEILVGLKAIRGVGEGVAEAISAEAANGAFVSIDDFVNRVPAYLLNKGVLEGLSLAGAFDGLGYSRRTLKDNLPELAKSVVKQKKREEQGQFSLFDDEEAEEISLNIPRLPEYNKKDKLAFERHVLGLYVSDHPLSGVSQALSKHSDTRIIDIITGEVTASSGFGDRKKIKLAGVVNSVTKKPTKKGEMFAMFSIEDMTGQIPALMFPKTFQRLGDRLHADSIYKMTGSLLQRDGDDVSFSVDDIEEIELTEDGKIPLNLHLYESQVNGESMKELASLLKRHPGDVPVFLHIRKGAKIEVLRLADEYNIAMEDFADNRKSIRREIMELFGVDSVE